jgi:putative acetyltransferase
MYPDVFDPNRIGTYPALVNAGGGYVWDAVLECRVWRHSEKGAPDEEVGPGFAGCPLLIKADL